jgi:hypothetical protein
MNMKSLALLTIWIVAALLLPSCSYHYDRVTFDQVGRTPAGKRTIPDVAIDTNDTLGSWGGVVKSIKPYNVLALYVDYTFGIASAEFTKVTVTYADGSVDPGIAALKLPMRVGLSVYEVRKPTSSGTEVVADSRRLEARFPGVITRDEPFSLLIEGKFIKDNGAVIPFKIKEKYNMSRDKRKEGWVEFLNNC